jgi:predicted 3-demethylubiquinone-9 3-methyltransferase (glyoxalase superfamily)
MQTVTPFLWFDDQAEAAAKFYVSIFKNSKIVEIRRNGKKVMAATFRLDGREYIAFNGGPHYKLTPAFSMFVLVKTQREVDYFWNKLVRGGKPQRCGWLTDKFGLCWQIVPTILGELSGDKDEEKSGRALQAMMQMVKLDIKMLKAAATGKKGKL